MKIAILAPLTRAASADSRGSRPRIVFDLVTQLVKMGHDVTTFGTGDSKLPGKLVAISPVSIYKMEEAENPFYQHLVYLTRMMDILIDQSSQFDIIHSHLYPEVLPISFAKFLKSPMVVTPHLYMWPEIEINFVNHPEVSYIAVSENQKHSAPKVNFKKVIYNGIDVKDYAFNEKPKDYLLFFGRIKESDPKGVEWAIELAEKANEKLVIAGNVESEDYFNKKIKPHLSDKITFFGHIDAFGPVSFEQKVELYKNAKAYLFTIRHTEAFGMTMLESLACGTPVIASKIAATNEVIRDGENGFLVEPGNIDQMIEALKKIDTIKRTYCRKFVEDNFSLEKMARSYEAFYKEVIGC